MNRIKMRAWVALCATTACIAAACSENNPTAVKLPSGVHVVSSQSAGDTIGAELTQPLVVSLADSNGAPLAGRLVRFEGIVVPTGSDYDSQDWQMTVASVGSSSFRHIVYDTTDANGSASIRVKLGMIAGTGIVFIRDPERGTEDSAKFAIKPGAPVAVTVDPADSAAYVGNGYTLRSTLRDRGRNSRSGTPITYSLLSGPVTVGATTGVVTANTFGRATIVAQSGTFADTAFTSVVPRGVIAAGFFGYPATIDLVQLDGSGLQRLTGAPDNGLTSGWGFGWSPDGKDLAIGRGDSVYVITPGTVGRRMLINGSGVYLGARYSPDGRWIYYSGAEVGVRRVRSDGSIIEKVGASPGYGEYNARPTPSPDGNSILFISNYTACPRGAAAKVFDFATNAIRIYSGFDYVVCGSYAVWSRAGNVIGYTNDNEIGIINGDGTGKKILASDIRNSSYPEFSPDGRWLLVFQTPGGPVMLYDTQSSLRIPVPALAPYGFVAWRP